MSKGRLAGKVALITGASRGIGRATALAFAREGASIVVNYAGNAAAAKEVVGEIEKLGTRAIAIQADVGDQSHHSKLFEQTVSCFRRIDILVLNAGLLVGDKDLASTTPDDFDKTFNVNVKGPYFMTKVSILVTDNLRSLFLFVDTLSTGSSEVHARWWPHYLLLQLAHRCFHNHAQLPPLRRYQGCNRADEPCLGKGPR